MMIEQGYTESEGGGSEDDESACNSVQSDDERFFEDLGCIACEAGSDGKAEVEN